jgi:hypothetical protein
LPGPPQVVGCPTSPAVSRTPRTPLAHNTSPLTVAQGRCIVTSRVAEIGKQFGINIDFCGELVPGQNAAALASWRNTCRLTKLCWQCPGLSQERPQLPIFKKMEELSLGKSDTILMDLLYNVAYMGKGLRQDSNPSHSSRGWEISNCWLASWWHRPLPWGSAGMWLQLWTRHVEVSSLVGDLCVE